MGMSSLKEAIEARGLMKIDGYGGGLRPPSWTERISQVRYGSNYVGFIGNLLCFI